MKILDIISVMAVGSYFVPMIIVLARKIWRENFFLLFAAYWAIGGVINLADIIPGIPSNFIYVSGIFYNMLDIPFILAILYFTSHSPVVRKFAPIAIIITVGSEIVGMAKYGISYEALKYPLGLGIAMVLFIVIMEVVRYMQTISPSNRQNSKILIHAAILFEYATFIVIYIFDYFVESSKRQDSFIIYYLSTLVAILIASCGYLLYKKYEKNIQAY